MGDRIREISEDNKRYEICFDANVDISDSSMEIYSDLDGNRRVTIDFGSNSLNMTLSEEGVILNQNDDASVWESDELDTFLSEFAVQSMD